jgi:hypothetical protein
MTRATRRIDAVEAALRDGHERRGATAGANPRGREQATARGTRSKQSWSEQRRGLPDKALGARGVEASNNTDARGAGASNSTGGWGAERPDGWTDAIQQALC